MARVIDYADVLKQAEALGFRSAYYNAGAFAFPEGEAVRVVGWLGPDDPTIRPQFAEQAVRVPPPYPANLAGRFARIWPAIIGGEAWVMPKSHWAFELDHGNGPWLGPALSDCGIDADSLRPRTDGAAVAFTPGDPACARLIEILLAHLTTSDFAVLFPRHPVLLTVHHHQQLWWQTTDEESVDTLQKGRSSGAIEDSEP